MEFYPKVSYVNYIEGGINAGKCYNMKIPQHRYYDISGIRCKNKDMLKNIKYVELWSKEYTKIITWFMESIKKIKEPFEYNNYFYIYLHSTCIFHMVDKNLSIKLIMCDGTECAHNVDIIFNFIGEKYLYENNNELFKIINTRDNFQPIINYKDLNKKVNNNIIELNTKINKSVLYNSILSVETNKLSDIDIHFTIKNGIMRDKYNCTYDIPTILASSDKIVTIYDNNKKLLNSNNITSVEKNTSYIYKLNINKLKKNFNITTKIHFKLIFLNDCTIINTYEAKNNFIRYNYFEEVYTLVYN